MRLDSVLGAREDEELRDVQAQADKAAGMFGAFLSGLGVGQGTRAFGVSKPKDGPEGFALYAIVPNLVDEAELVDRYGDEVEVAVMEVAARNAMRDRQRPIFPGASIAPAGKGWSGTLGFFHGDFAVTNWHVAESGIGTPILQPSHPDGGRTTDAIGVIDRLPQLDFSGGQNRVDAARVLLNPDGDYMRHNLAIQAEPSGFRELSTDDLGRPVRKVGRTTEATAGKVSAVDVRGLRVSYGGGRVATFSGQYEFTMPGAGAFSAGGDSGSAILDEDGKIVSLLFAGGVDGRGTDRTFGNPILEVLEALELREVE